MQKNTFYFEALGNAIFYSLNYDRLLVDKPKWKLAGRIGFCFIPGFDNKSRKIYGSPLEISYLRGKKKSFAEFGFGITALNDNYQLLPELKINELIMIAALRLGYRHQNPAGGLFYRFGIIPLAGVIFDISPSATPIHHFSQLEGFAYPLISACIGYTLKK